MIKRTEVHATVIHDLRHRRRGQDVVDGLEFGVSEAENVDEEGTGGGDGGAERDDG